MFNDHFQRIFEGVKSVFNLSNLSKWISEHTTIADANGNDRAYSYKGREFQQTIIDDPAKDLYVVKCAQVGMSEIFARWGISAVATQPNFTLMWTFPTSTDAELFAKARLDPFIQGSDELKRLLNRQVDSTSLKQFGKNSFVYIRGTVSETGALSVPADMLIHDEYDRSDMDNISAYVSRLQAKPTKMRRIFSTPTVAKFGIDLLSGTSKRWRQMWKCNHCNNQWLPDFETDVVIPGYGGMKKEINANNIKDIRWSESKLLCPHCGLEPDPGIENREWVCENINQHFPSKTYFISPFCAPLVIPPVNMVSEITRYKKWSEFQNQVLGLCAEDDSETLTEFNIRAALMSGSLDSSELHFLGIDMGVTCHFTVVRKDFAGKVLVVHREKANYSQFEAKRSELATKYRVISTVMDMFPYTDLVRTVTDFDPNAYGAVYIDWKSAETHRLKLQDEEEEEGKLNVRTVHINRNVAFDELMGLFKRREIVIPELEDKEELVAHLRDMKRVQAYDRFGGLTYRWVKTQGLDHWHHSLLYAYIAIKLRGAYQVQEDALASLVSTVHIKSSTKRHYAGSIMPGRGSLF